MSVAPTTTVSLAASYCTELPILSDNLCNVLVEGAVHATDAVLCLLRAHLREPVVWRQPAAPLDLPTGETCALILQDAATLSSHEQRRLLLWTSERGSRTRIISTTERPLFALVANGLFDAALYYRLNVMLLRVSAAHPAWQDGSAAGVPRMAHGSERHRSFAHEMPNLANE